MRFVALLVFTLAAVHLAPRAARACSPAWPALFAPGEKARPVPQNFRFVSWRGYTGDWDYELADAAGQGVPLRRELLGDRVDTMPVEPVEPGSYRFRREGRGELELTVRQGVDRSPPKLLRVGRPHEVRYSAVGTCKARVSANLRILASDDSPLIFAVWGIRQGEPDLTRNPALYTTLDAGELPLWHALDTLDPGPGAGSWAVMAIDAAGNVSEVVSTPSGRRVPGIVFAATPASLRPEAPARDAGTPQELGEPERWPLAKPPAQPAPRGCGCDAPGGGRGASTAWLLPLVASVVGAWRRRGSLLVPLACACDKSEPSRRTPAVPVSAASAPQAVAARRTAPSADGTGGSVSGRCRPPVRDAGADSPADVAGCPGPEQSARGDGAEVGRDSSTPASAPRWW